VNNLQGWIRVRAEEKENDAFNFILPISLSSLLLSILGNCRELLETFGYFFWLFLEFSGISSYFLFPE
jgi:hypothetical protein